MTPVETIRLAMQHNVHLSVNGDRLVVKSELPPPPELLAALRANKSALVKMLVAPVNEPSKRGPRRDCNICGKNTWWQRTDGGWVCDVCHPDPAVLLERWRAAREDAKTR